MPPLPYRFYLRGAVVRRRLYDLGIPYRVLAEQIGITRPYLTQIINGHMHLTAEMRYRLREAKALEGLSDDDLWERAAISPDVLPMHQSPQAS